MTSELHEALRVRPIAAVLLDAGFQPARGTPIGDTAPDALVWLGEHAGQTLKILAGVDWFGQWKLVGTMNTQRVAMWDERQVLDDWPQGAVLAEVLKLWRSAFGEAGCPAGLRLGNVYALWNTMRAKLNPGLPHLLADGPMLRSIVNRLREAVERGRIPQDGRLRIAQLSRQMLLRTDDVEWMCPATGFWIGMADVKLTDFLLAVPPRFRRGRVAVECDGKLLTVCGGSMLATWLD